jgi:hypothetical protein
VPREVFGIRKKAVTKPYYYPRNPQLRKAFLEHLREMHGISRVRLYSRVAAHRFMRLSLRVVSHIEAATRPTALSLPTSLKTALHAKTIGFWKQFNLSTPVYVWAVSTLAARAEQIYARHGVARHDAQTSTHDE